jgi:uncharacterized membrane protein required for colicin V production
LNLMDVFFLLLFVGALALGFFQGMVRLLVLILAFYLSVVLASLYFPALANVFVNRFGTERYVGEYMGFIIVLLLAVLILGAAGLYTFRYAQLPGQLQYIDRILGLVLGLLFGTLLISIFAVVLWNMMIVRGGRTVDFPLMRFLGSQVAGSTLLQFFANQLLGQIYTLVDPVLPDGAQIIFAVQ